MDSPSETAAPGGSPPPEGPTAAPPGTPEKLAILEARAQLGLELFHPFDAAGPPRRHRARARAGRVSILQLVSDPASRRLLEESLREGIPVRLLLSQLGASEPTVAAARRRLRAEHPELVGERARRNFRRGRPVDLLGRPESRRALEEALRDGTPADRVARLLDCGTTTVLTAMRHLRHGRAPSAGPQKGGPDAQGHGSSGAPGSDPRTEGLNACAG